MQKAALGPILIILFSGILSSLPLPLNETLEDSFIDLQFKLRGERRLSDEIVLVFIGAEDVQALGGWPVTRDYYGYMTHVLSRLGARVIGFDILCDTPNRNYPEFDNILADFMQSAGNVCLPMTFAELAHEQIKTLQANLPYRIMIGRAPSFPFTRLKEHAAGLGFGNFGTEPIVRQAPLVVAYGDSFILSFGVELARLYLNGARAVKTTPDAIIIKDASGKSYSFPVDRQGRMRLNHFGNIDHLATIGFVDLLQAFESAPDSSSFSGKIVVVAGTAPSMPILKATPLADALPAALIHATVAENLIQRNYLRELPALIQLMLVVLLAVSAWLVWQSNRGKFIFAAGAGILLLYWIVAMLLFSKANLVFPLFYPTLAYVASFSYAGLMQRRAVDESMTRLFQEQIVVKEAQLEETKFRLVELQRALAQRTADSEQTRQMAEERQNAILALEKELRDLRAHVVSEEQFAPKQFPEIVHAATGKMAAILATVDKIGSEDIPVLLLGETGTGKEMIARAIHQSGGRRNAPFVAINCGALPETLLESELFGHEKGSFTGATSRRRGRFELADKGTVFLDEITETTPAFQARLLRALQEGTFERLGGEQTIKVDVRVIAACNKYLSAEVEAGRFRADLFYRLNGFPITLPPLRERQDDIQLLAAHFLKKHGYQQTLTFSEQAMEILRTFTWPGNVRELENIVRRAAILAQSEGRNIVQAGDLPKEIAARESPRQVTVVYQPLEEQVLDMLRALKFSRSAITQTAKALGNRDRGTITEYFRGLCFEHLVKADYDVEAAAQTIAATSEGETIGRVQEKIDEYLKNLRASNASEALFKGLPKKYHPYLQQIIQRFDKNTWRIFY
ncbi:sigma 54-interacting transcriptional regulator [candidate division KSB1 bacterium]|nr:sigma 54-interacting transcriptional regulator [candidate division KSB1 bacterium]